MKSRIMTIILLSTLLQLAHAQQPMILKIEMPPQPVSWFSKNATDFITINNGNGDVLVITIIVDKNLPPSAALNYSNMPGFPAAAGVNINNCGGTTHINPGSSAICATKDPGNPVSFSSDNPNLPALGSYLVKQGG